MDGTILDTLRDLADSVNWALRECGLPERSYAEIRRFLGNGIFNLIRRSVPEGTPLPEPDYPIAATPAPLAAGDIDIETLAERLTGRKNPGWHSLAEAFPSRQIPAGVELEPEWRELLAQLESFLSPRFRE